MFLCCQPQWGRVIHAVPTDLLSCFLTDRAVQLVGTPLPRQVLLQRKRTPGTAGFNLFGALPQ